MKSHGLRRNIVRVKFWKASLGAFVIDVCCVALFVFLAKGLQDGNATFAATLGAMWPFFLGLIAGWIATVAWTRPRAIIWPGVPIWMMTVAVGMLVRISFEEVGVELGLITGAAIFLGISVVGWRVLARTIDRALAERLVPEEVQ